jgi:FtsP/CotA-like multicopper oxidase with cupredoxin domain
MKLTEVPHFSDHNSAFNESTLKPCILLGGVGDITKCHPGTTNDTEIKGPFRLSFQKGQRYLLRVINTSYRAGFTFSIDNHEMWVVSADFVPITPYSTTAIRVNIGQRYNIVIVANPINSSDTHFWIRTYQSPCGSVGSLGPNYMNTGIVSYGNSTGPDPTSTQWPNAHSKECKDEPLLSIQPIVPWTPPDPSNSDVPRVILTGNPPPGLPNLFYAINPNNSDFQPLQVQWGNPTFTNLQNTNWPNLSVIVPEDFSAEFNNVTSFTSKWASFSPLVCTIIECLAKITYQIYLKIQSDDDHPVSQNKSDQISSELSTLSQIHLHGHDFAIFNLTYSDNSVEPSGPSVPRRDVFTVPGGGFATIAFPADNPGAWLLHCHIAGHASSGLDLQVLEDQVAANSIWPKGESPALATASSLCTSWSSWCTAHPTACVETDSGV